MNPQNPTHQFWAIIAFLGGIAGLMVVLHGFQNTAIADLRTELTGEIDKLETRLDTRVTTLKNDIDTRFLSVDQNLKELEASIATQFSNVEQNIETLAERVRTTERRISRLEGHLGIFAALTGVQDTPYLVSNPLAKKGFFYFGEPPSGADDPWTEVLEMLEEEHIQVDRWEPPSPFATKESARKFRESYPNLPLLGPPPALDR